MRYGGTLRDAGQAIGKSGDEEIDGIIKEDRLGLDIICIEARSGDYIVGHSEIQNLLVHYKVIVQIKVFFITTSDFSKDAYEYVARFDSKIVLING